MPVDDPFVVCRGQRIGDLTCDRQGLTHRQRTAAQAIGKRAPSSSSRTMNRVALEASALATSLMP